MARGQLQAAFGHQIEEGVWRDRCGFVDGTYHGLILMRAADCEHLGIFRTDHLSFVAKTACDDHPAIFGKCFTDGFQRFFLGRIEKATGIDENDVGAFVVGRQAVTVAPQLGQYALAIDERLGAAERNHADFRRCGKGGDHCGGVSRYKSKNLEARPGIEPGCEDLQSST
jgi:hypothetical protein